MTALRRALLPWVVLSLIACDPAPSIDAGPRDAGARDAPRAPDAGFDPSALSPCELDPSGGFDGDPFASYAWLPASPTARRLFYPLVVLDDDGSADEPAGIIDERRAGARAVADCAGEAGCVRNAVAFDEAAAALAGDAVVSLLSVDALPRVAAHLRGAGICSLVLDESDANLVSGCIEQTLVELSLGLGFLGEIPPTELDTLADEIASMADGLAFYGPLTMLIERGLALAERPEPIRYEPLEDENRAAIDALAAVDFSTFPFVAIVVPGQGPTDAETALNPAGQARADLGYDRWMAGLAPVVLLSGGHVHPDRTVYSEAIEMRRYLMESRGMPASAILVDPYARHTTTNLRNATRILARAGVPTDRPILITSDRIQSLYIASSVFSTRCDDELGYQPFAELTVLSTFDSCMLPVPASLHVAASDPLDP
jgi:hypothetical protein